MNANTFSIEERYIFDLSLTNDQVRYKLLYTFGKQGKLLNIQNLIKLYLMLIRISQILLLFFIKIMTMIPWRKSEERD
ncbi:DNA-directed RNA polymerase subunit beta'' [Platanthera zijinensis]|uniref:DNA-directed RNA polymerase subunit beta n=1 Tax=Platanthera zijinensis TaxID=2320716 RepID=A0AAP0C1P3_9ASPA